MPLPIAIEKYGSDKMELYSGTNGKHTIQSGRQTAFTSEKGKFWPTISSTARKRLCHQKFASIISYNTNF